MIQREKGITLIVLVVTIVVLIIIASISIGILGGEDGLIQQAKKAKEATEIAKEKEILGKSAVQAAGKDVYGNIEESILQEELDEETGRGKTEATDVGDEIEVIFKDSNRYYSVDKNGNVGDAQEIIKDKNPGDITTGKDGEQLDGSEEKPYEIWCIEDLVVFSNMVNGEGVKFENGEIKQITANYAFSGKYVKLMRTLNFKSKFSYMNSYRTDFGDINGDPEDGNILMNEMTTGNCFKPIGDEKNINKCFSGIFDGNNNSIINLCKNGLFSYAAKATIKNICIYGAKEIINNNGIITRADNVEIKNCINYCNLSNSNTSRVGGIISFAGGYIKVINCINYGKIEGYGYGIGGIIGYVTGKSETIIENCYNFGDVNFKNGISYSGAGGIIGLNHYPENKITINNCFNTGNIAKKAIHNGNLIGNSGNAQLDINDSYIISNDINAVGNGNYNGNIETKTIEEIQSQEFINLLNEKVVNNNEWRKWKLGSNGFPTFE